jgi:hypothetical protein
MVRAAASLGRLPVASKGEAASLKIGREQGILAPCSSTQNMIGLEEGA